MQGAELFVCPLLTIEDDTGLSNFKEDRLYFEQEMYLFESRILSFERRLGHPKKDGFSLK